MKYFMLLLVALCSCSGPSLTYTEAMRACHESPDTFLLGEAKIPRLNKNCLIGAQLPFLDEVTITGKKIDEAYFDNKVNMINFWFETCPPCVAEIPAFNKLVDKYGKKDVRFLAFGNDKKSDIETFLIDHPFNFDQVANSRTKITKDIFQISWGYPTTIITDKKGIIVSVLTGGPSALDSEGIEKHFAKFDEILRELI